MTLSRTRAKEGVKAHAHAFSCCISLFYISYFLACSKIIRSSSCAVLKRNYPKIFTHFDVIFVLKLGRNPAVFLTAVLDFKVIWLYCISLLICFVMMFIRNIERK